MKLFISHSSTDKKFVRTLKEDLTENNIDTWFDEDELNLGDSLSDKLESALEESSHFLIILSSASVNSEWVKFELDKALKQNKSQLLQKIIPVKYSACDVPKELASLMYTDLSNEVRQIRGDKVSFVSEGYSAFLIKLCKTIRNSEKVLTQSDRRILRKEVVEEQIKEQSSILHHIVKANYTLLGYKDTSSKKKYVNIILDKIKNKTLEGNAIRPILLPPLLKSIFKNITYGDALYFSKDYAFNEIGHFAGFRKDDLSITIPLAIRNGIGVTNGRQYKVEINTKENRITFLTG